MKKYSKFILAAVAGLVAVADSLYGPGNTASQIVLAVATALGVFAVPNEASEE